LQSFYHIWAVASSYTLISHSMPLGLHVKEARYFGLFAIFGPINVPVF